MHASANTSDDKLRNIMRWIGLGLTLGVTAFTTMFGAAINENWIVCAFVILVLLCFDFGNSYVWPYAVRKLREGALIEGRLALAIGAVCTVVCLTTAFGSVNHVFGGSVKAANVQAVVYDDIGVTINKAEADEAFYVGRVKSLSDGNSGWSTSVTAEGLRAKLPGLNLAIEQEAKRGGCGPNCLARTKERDDIEGKIKTLEEMDNASKALKVARDQLAKLRAQRKDTKAGNDSVADSQNDAIASAMTVSLKPSEAAKAWTGRAVAWLVTVSMVFGALGFNMLGWLDGIKSAVRGMVEEIELRASVPAPSPPAPTMASPYPQPVDRPAMVHSNAEVILEPRRKIYNVRSSSFAARLAGIERRFAA